jgi:hypothetical protein
MEVARAARRFPVILELLAEGSVNLTAVKLLAPHLTPENHGDVLRAARGKRKAGIEEMVARLAPKADVRCSVRRVPASPTSQASGLPPSNGMTALPIPLSDAVEEPLPAPLLAAASAAADPPMPRAGVTPLSPDRYRFQVTIGAETLEKIRLAKDMLGHALPSGDDDAILDRAYSALLVELAKKKFARNVDDRWRISQQVGPGGSGWREGKAAGAGSLGGDAKARASHPARGREACGPAPRPGAVRVRRSERPGATSAASWSSTISTLTRWAGRPRWTASSCGAGGTTTTRAGRISAREGAGHPLAATASLFWNKSV